MYKIKLQQKKDKQIIVEWGFETKIGDLMEMMEEGACFKHILLRAYGGIFDLNNPHISWSGDNPDGMRIHIKLLPKGTVIKLKVE